MGRDHRSPAAVPNGAWLRRLERPRFVLTLLASCAVVGILGAVTVVTTIDRE